MQHPTLKDDPCDVILVSQEGEEFKAHRSLLSEASPFFNKLLNADMKESREGIIRLKGFSSSVVKDILSFVYTGRFRIWLHSAEELLAASDFLLLPDLKSFVPKALERNLSPSNCLSTLRLAERNHFEKLRDEATRFICLNFVAVSNSTAFVNLSFEEAERWFARPIYYQGFNIQDDICKLVHSMKWADPDERKRKEEFEELFPLGIVAVGGKETFCYLPSKDQWYSLASSKYYFDDHRQLLSVKGTLYNFSLKLFGSCFLCWSPWSKTDQWAMLKLPGKLVPEMVAVLGDAVYGVASDSSGRRKLICKYSIEDNSWETIHSCDADVKRGACMIGLSKYLYFFGGMPASKEACKFSTAERKFEKVTDMQQGRYDAFGAAEQGKIYIAGGKQQGEQNCYLQTCEVYDVATKEWQFIGSLNFPRFEASMVCYDGVLYVLGGFHVGNEGPVRTVTVECYDKEANKWKEATTIPNQVSNGPCKFQACLLRNCKRYFDAFPPLQ